MSEFVLPLWYTLAQAEIGAKEAPGFANNPIVQQYYIDAGAGKMPDSVPWCAAFVGAMLVRSARASSGYLAARSYERYGNGLKEPTLGCIVVLSRGQSWQGHVGFFNRMEKNGKVRILGGNQKGDAVNYSLYDRRRVVAYRWPFEKE